MLAEIAADANRLVPKALGNTVEPQKRVCYQKKKILA